MENKKLVSDVHEIPTEEINFTQTLFCKLQRFSDENGGNKIDWKNRTQRKFFIQYEPSYGFLVDYYYFDKEFGQVYFASEDIAEKAIELFYDDLIKYFTHDWNKRECNCSCCNHK